MRYKKAVSSATTIEIKSPEGFDIKGEKFITPTISMENVNPKELYEELKSAVKHINDILSQLESYFIKQD